ncbi:L,D-transpeptidase family protein [Streptomyces sp. NPDC001787]|uniref:L,D-transpeptidase family protein n=1 Tax=Streptomyces sp. NPDC001787 TaxID=3154523 RepID=UPI00332E7809
MSVPRRPSLRSTAPILLLILLLTGCSMVAPDATDASPAGPPRGAAGPEPAVEAMRAAPSSPAPPARPAEIPGLGPGTRALIPSTALQAFVVTGEAADSHRATAALYTRDAPARSWRRLTAPWPAHNGMKGWTDLHVSGDLKSPNGVYSLTDAGGRLPDPGSRLPYDEQPHFAVSGDGFFGEPLEGSFDYVVAINYNRAEGVSPLDRARPLGLERGGGIWIHVDHGGPTQGCVSLPEERMKELLLTLDPAKKPVIVMGDAAALGR